MGSAKEPMRSDFEQAMGESFSECLVPPIPFEQASAHECCEVIWSALGYDITPALLAALTQVQIAGLSRKFGDYFDSDSPTAEQINEAIFRTLERLPIGLLDECE